MSVSQEIESKIDILELAQEYVQLKKSGRNWKGLSPFKSERTPSFIVSPDKNIAYCFATHKGGGPLKFLMEIEKLTFGEALQILAKRAGVDLKTNYYKEANDSAGNLYEIHEKVAAFYHQRLLAPENKDKKEYICGRWLSEKSLEKWSIGYADKGRELWEELVQKGYPEKDIIESGIFVAPGKDKFFGRITFPIRNYRGDIVGFSARITESGKEPKYLNSPTTRIFDKSNTLFWFSFARQEIAKKDTIIVVEGQMDVISLHQAGFHNVVALSGTALTPQQIRHISRICRTIILCLDNDSAGINATFSSIESLQNTDLNIAIIPLWKHKDPDEILKWQEYFWEYLQKAESHIAFIIRQGWSRYDINTAQGKKQLAQEVLKKLISIDSVVEIDIYLSEVSNKLSITKEILHAELRNLKRNSHIPENRELPKERSGNKQEWPPVPQDDYRDIIKILLPSGARELFLSLFPFDLQDIPPAGSHLIAFLETWGMDEEDRKILELEQESLTLNTTLILDQDAVRECAHKLAKRIYQEKLSALHKKLDEDPSNMTSYQQYAELIAFGKKHLLI